MPTRNDASGSVNPPRQRVTAPPVAQPQSVAAQAQPADDGTGDVWDEISTITAGDEGGFNKMNTSFYLRDGEAEEIVIMSENPVVFFAHNIKCLSKKNSIFYRTEACQKNNGPSCIMCDSTDSAIGKARKTIAFLVLDARGTYKTPKNGQGAFDGVPAPKIFLVPVYLAKQLKVLKDDGGGLSDKIITLSKNGNYVAQFAMEKFNDGTLRYRAAPVYDGDLPDIVEVYRPQADRELLDFMQQFAASGAPVQQQQQQQPQQRGFGAQAAPAAAAPRRGGFGS